MKNFIPLAFLLCLTAAAINAQGVNYIKITDEDRYTKVADFSNTFEVTIYNPGSQKSSKCQAVRIHKNWYVTAAHCITPICDKACNIEVRVVVGPNYEMNIVASHTPSTPHVYKNHILKGPVKSPAYDIALLRVPAKDGAFRYKNPAAKTYIPERVFLNSIPDYNIYYKAENGTNLPEILSVSSARSRALKRNVSVVSIWDGKRNVLAAKSPLLYSPSKKFWYAENFGIVKGISGSGVMANTGELVGIVSATADFTVTNPDGTKNTTPVTFVAPFNEDIMDFIKALVPDIAYQAALNDFLKPVPQKYSLLSQGIEQAKINNLN